MEIAHADMIETEALAEQAAARHYLYQLLARAFAEEPDDALREALSSPLTAQAWRCLVEAGAVEKCGELDSDLRRSDLAAALSRPEGCSSALASCRCLLGNRRTRPARGGCSPVTPCWCESSTHPSDTAFRVIRGSPKIFLLRSCISWQLCAGKSSML